MQEHWVPESSANDQGRWCHQHSMDDSYSKVFNEYERKAWYLECSPKYDIPTMDLDHGVNSFGILQVSFVDAPASVLNHDEQVWEDHDKNK